MKRCILPILLAACASGHHAGGTGGSDDPVDAPGSTTDPDGGSTSSSDANPDAAPPTAPFDVSWCPGGQITSDQVLARFAPAATMATLGTVWIDARMRNCQDQTGCQGWMPSPVAPMFKINWTGTGFTFINRNDVPVPQSGVATCTVPGPNCSLTIGPVTSTIYPHDTSNPSFLWGVSPRIAGAQVQVGSWSTSPSGNYITWGQVTTTNSCLWGTQSGRIYGSAGQYTEFQMVIYGQY